MNPIATEIARKGMANFAAGHGANWKRWLRRHIGQPIHGLEIGTFRGDSAEWAMQNIYTHENSHLTCVDPWRPEGSVEHKDAGIDCSDNYEFAQKRLAKYVADKRLSLVRSPSDLFFLGMEAVEPVFDVIYIDGSHEGPDVMFDACMSFFYLKEGGVMIFDDYRWRVYNAPHRPMEAIDMFEVLYKERLGERAIRLNPNTDWQAAFVKARV